MSSIAEQYSDYTAAFTYDAIPEEVRRRACYLILDASGIALAASTFEFAHQTVNALSSFGNGDSSVIGMPVKLALRDAVLANGSFVHGLDFDDTHLQGVIHISSSCFPTALAVAAQTGKSGRELLEAYVLGVELATRLGKVAQGELNQVGFHPTGVVAAFGCALIAGKLYGLNREQLTMAQGVVYSMAAGTREYSTNSSGSKRLHPGWAGVAGITAAVLARAGITGPRTTYEGPFGLYATHLKSKVAPGLLASTAATLGQQWETMHVAIKPYPAGQLSIVFIDAAIQMASRYELSPDDIAEVEALVPAHAVKIVCEPEESRKRPRDSYAAQFSLQFGIACGLARRKFGLEELEDYGDPALLALADRVKYRIDPDSGYPDHWSGEINVTLKNGKTIRYRDEDTRGGFDKPLDEREILNKYTGNAHMATDSARSERICEMILNLPDHDANDVARRLSVS